MSAGPITLVAMTDAEVDRYRLSGEEDYARQRVDLGGENEQDARATAARQMAEYFPAGKPAEGHHLFIAREQASGDAVGVLWLCERRGAGGLVVWIYDVEIDEAHRGRGFGRALMSLAEQWARERDAVELQLNVFGGNDVARALYSSLGYAESAVTMTKRLASG